MEEKEKRLEEQIKVLKETLINLNEMNINHDKVKREIRIIEETIIDKQLTLLGLKTNLSFKDRVVNNFIRNKLVLLNLVWLIFEFLNYFTDFFNTSENEFVKGLGLLIPAITIYLKTEMDKEQDR